MTQSYLRRILLAEDDPASERVAVTILQGLGWHVDVAPTGTEAVRLFETHEYELVLMDWLMPEMNGFEATVRMRQHPRGLLTPIVGTSANRTAQECLSAGMDDLIPKPFNRLKIEMAIRKWVPRSGPDARPIGSA